MESRIIIKKSIKIVCLLGLFVYICSQITVYYVYVCRIMDILDRLIMIRKDMKISITDMSGFLDISRGSLYNYENRVRDIPFRILAMYADRFGYELRLMLK